MGRRSGDLSVNSARHREVPPTPPVIGRRFAFLGGKIAAKERRERKEMRMRQHKAAHRARGGQKRPINKAFRRYNGLAHLGWPNGELVFSVGQRKPLLRQQVATSFGPFFEGEVRKIAEFRLRRIGQPGRLPEGLLRRGFTNESHRRGIDASAS